MDKKQLPYRHNTGFKTPENYFSDFEKELMEKLQHDAIGIKKVDAGFTVPENYFDTFKVSLPIKQGKVIPLYRKRAFRFAMSTAAVLALIFTLVSKNYNDKPSFADVEYETVEHYIESDYINIQNPAIKQIISQGVLTNEIDLSRISNEALFDYLMKNTSTEISLLNR